MALRKWIKTSEDILIKNNWWEYHKDTFRLPSGMIGEYHFVHTNGSSLVIPLLENHKIVLVNQYRYLCNKESIEFPCGSIKPGESYLETAQKELKEEANLRAGKLELIGNFNPYNGVTDEICKVYLATELTEETGIPDDTEEFEIIEKSIEEIENLIKQNIIWDGMTISAFYLFLNKFKEKI
jgi:ADP-ribose pyrophosphatase